MPTTPEDMRDAPSSLALGVIGNGSVAVLIDARGRIVWGCLPRFDSDASFCALLSPLGDGGDWTIQLEDFEHAEQHYMVNTAVLVTRLYDRHGAGVEILDFVPRFRSEGRFYHPVLIARRVRPIGGAPRIRVLLRPLCEYGGQAPQTTSGSNHIRYLLTDVVQRLTSDVAVPMIERGLAFSLERPAHFVLGPDETLKHSPADFIHHTLDRTLEYWREWVRNLSVPYEWQEAVIRSAITLKLCQYEATGAIVAALTTSIPESPYSTRNWDYRYCWLRDAAFTVRALNRLGATRSMEEYIRYVFNLIAADGEREIGPVFGITFEHELTERQVDSLAGYRSMGPVRVGNDAWRQRQNDVYGSVVLASAQLFFDRRLEHPGDELTFRRLERMGQMALRMAEEPDAGLWEFRGRAAVHTYSAAMCWAACDRLAHIATELGLDERARHWHDEAIALHARIEARCWNDKLGYFVDAYDGEHLDASLLLLADIGFVDCHDPRFVATVDAIGTALGRGDYLFRYIAPDDFGAPETSFNICTFWYIDALAATGRHERARAMFEHMLAQRNPLGLLSEDIAPSNGEHWGNFSADLFDGWPHPGRHAPVAALGGRIVIVGSDADRSRLVVVSNRVALPEQTATGGLASAMRAALQERGGLWFGWSGKLARQTAAEVHRVKDDTVEYATIDLSRADHDDFYDGFANRTLWPLLHYRPDLVDYSRRHLAGYLRVNSVFADQLMSLIGPHDLVWVNDYHLIPLAAMLRERGVRNRVGFFLHTPLPAAGLLITLPRHRELLETLACYDLVGLHTARDRRALEEYFLYEIDATMRRDGRLRTHEGRIFRAATFPIGIDTRQVADDASHADEREEIGQLRKSLEGRALIIGVDRLDYSKGLAERFQAYARLLERAPELHRKVSFLQIAPPSRGGVPEYRQIRRELERSAGHINGMYAAPDWVPIRYVNNSFPHTLLSGYYRTARVGLVTPLRDGMNLVAKEYVASQDPDDPGVLVLSRFAGAAQELTDALLVNPADTEEVAEALERALTMPLQERRARWRRMMDVLERHDVTAWRTTFLQQLAG